MTSAFGIDRVFPGRTDLLQFQPYETAVKKEKKIQGDKKKREKSRELVL